MRSVCGMHIGYDMFSNSFSVPRWRYPIIGLASMIRSPSIFRMTRNTPCVDGCCGPKLTSISWTSNMGCSGVSEVGGLGSEDQRNARGCRLSALGRRDARESARSKAPTPNTRHPTPVMGEHHVAERSPDTRHPTPDTLLPHHAFPAISIFSIDSVSSSPGTHSVMSFVSPDASAAA